MTIIPLLSGGLDSCVAFAMAAQELQAFAPDDVFPLNFDYGQRHSQELTASEDIAEAYGLRYPFTVPLSAAFGIIGGSSLTSGVLEGNPSQEDISIPKTNLPPTFVPGRNIIMLSIAAAFGYTRRKDADSNIIIVGGWNAVDYSGYPDCRPAFIDSMAVALNQGLGALVFIYAPLLRLTKAEIIAKGLALGAPLSLTWSCYAGGLTPCGECDSCKIRAAGFAAVGVPDPGVKE